MAFTAAQIAYIRSQLGAQSPPTDEELYTAYERLGTVEAVVVEQLETRLADLLNAPDSFTVPGVYGESNRSRIEALQPRLAAARRAAAVAAGNGTAEGRLVRTDLTGR